MTHRFFDLPRRTQWWVSTFGVIFGAVLILSSIFISMYAQQVWLLFLLIPLYFVFAQLLDIPFGHLRGTIIHYSPMLLAQRHQGKYHIHTTTLFDQLFCLPDKQPHLSNQTQTLIWIIDGFIAFIQALKKEKPCLIVGSTYFLSERRAQKLGFTITSADPLTRIILVLNYLNLILTMSITKERLSFPSLNKVIGFEISSVDLIAREAFFVDWQRKLAERTKTRKEVEE